MDILAKLAENIIEDQETIIGPIAIEQAKNIPGLAIDWQKRQVTMQGNKTQILEKLVEQYRTLFGQASVEVCKETVNKYRDQLSAEQLPQLLR